jgi:Ca2+-transporting ATPase
MPADITSLPVTFRPPSARAQAGDLLSDAAGLQMTRLVGMVDPTRDESKAAVASAQAAHMSVRIVTGDDITGRMGARAFRLPMSMG